MIISTLHNLNLFEESNKLRGGQEISKIALQNMSTYFLRDFRRIDGIIKKYQDQINAWTTHFNVMEENSTLLNQRLQVKLKEKEGVFTCFQKDLQQCLPSNATFALLTTHAMPSLDFELHTHGIGFKFLHQMHYNSGNLGKN
jgi:hypothetical protein